MADSLPSPAEEEAGVQRLRRLILLFVKDSAMAFFRDKAIDKDQFKDVAKKASQKILEGQLKVDPKVCGHQCEQTRQKIPHLHTPTQTKTYTYTQTQTHTYTNTHTSKKRARAHTPTPTHTTTSTSKPPHSPLTTDSAPPTFPPPHLCTHRVCM